MVAIADDIDQTNGAAGIVACDIDQAQLQSVYSISDIHHTAGLQTVNTACLVPYAGQLHGIALAGIDIGYAGHLKAPEPAGIDIGYAGSLESLCWLAVEIE